MTTIRDKDRPTPTRSVDSSWDYRGEFTKTYTHGFHSYPAMMIPQVAGRLIEAYSKRGETLLDPFCGSGSVLVEARLSGRHSWGIDLNPLAILVARVKTTPIDPSALQRAFFRLLESARELPDDSVTLPDFPNLHFWFKERVIIQLAKLRQAINSIEVKEIKEFFQVAFSEVVRLSSNSRSKEFKLYRYAPERLQKHQPDVFKLFIEKASNNIMRVSEFHKDDGSEARVRLAEWDTRRPVPEIEQESIDIVVTSPPYGDSRTTVAYGQFSRLSSQWLDLIEGKGNLDREMLGGKPAPDIHSTLDSPTLKNVAELVAKKDRLRGREVLSFYSDFNQCLQQIASYLRRGGHACLVMGNRRVKGIELPTDIITTELGKAHGLFALKIIVRNIPSKTMPLKNSPTNVKGAPENTMHHEYIVILRKEA